MSSMMKGIFAVYSVSYHDTTTGDTGCRYFKTYNDAKEFWNRYEISGYSVRMRQLMTDDAAAAQALVESQTLTLDFIEA